MRLRLILPALVSLSLAPTAFASDIVDQQNNASPTSYLGPSSTPGQSFTPTASSIDFATFSLATESGADVSAILYAGDGFGGSTVATSTNNVLISSSSFQGYTFLFGPAVSLTPGSVYTLQLVNSTGQTLYEYESSGNTYTGGQEYDSAGVGQTGYDLIFSEGYSPASVAATPEPGSFALLGTGMAGLTALWRKRRT